MAEAAFVVWILFLEPLENFGDNSNMFDDTQTPKQASAID